MLNGLINTNDEKKFSNLNMQISSHQIFNLKKHRRLVPGFTYHTTLGSRNKINLEGELPDRYDWINSTTGF